MRPTTIVTLRVVLALSLVGSLAIQVLILPAVWGDLSGAPFEWRLFAVVIIALWLVCLQIVAICIWPLVSMAADVAVFSAAAFRFVNLVIAAFSLAAILTAGLAPFLLPGEVAPGVVGIIYGVALATGGVALVVVVMKSLLRKAIEMRTELDEVV